MNLELTHYGVKGMKWGIVRKDRKAGRKAAKNHIKMVSNFLNKILQFENRLKRNLKRLSGTMRRISRSGNESLTESIQAAKHRTRREDLQCLQESPLATMNSLTSA